LPNYRLADLHDRHHGERCVLVANGPSLNDMNLSFLKNEITIGLNKIFIGFRRFNFYPKYYVATNRYVIEQSVEEIKQLCCTKFISKDAASDLLEEDALTYLFDVLPSRDKFHVDIRNGLREGYTVTYAALQCAFHLGFSEVILIGLDHRFDFDGEPNQAAIMSSVDSSHFDPHYFGVGQVWQHPDLEQSERSYEIAYKAFQEAGRSIVDATVNGACRVFPKVDYQELFEVAR
jgi:hypothetical protein